MLSGDITRALELIREEFDWPSEVFLVDWGTIRCFSPAGVSPSRLESKSITLLPDYRVSLKCDFCIVVVMSIIDSLLSLFKGFIVSLWVSYVRFGRTGDTSLWRF